MDPRYSAQDVVRCTLCEMSLPTMYCEICLIHLCKFCVSDHLNDFSKEHFVIPLKQYWTRLNYPKCTEHPTKQCELHCKQCDSPVCLKCIFSEKHKGHAFVEVNRKLKR